MSHNIDAVVKVIGAGFAGVEAAWTLATRGVKVQLFEMRPQRRTPAHTTDFFAELVCSNSLKSMLPTSPAGLLKSEMERLGSLVLVTAAKYRVPGGEALCVDRDAFGAAITTALDQHENVEVVREEFTPAMMEDSLAKNETVILATGPLTSPEMSDWLAAKTGRKHLYFYDAVSPTIDASTLDRSIIFAESRYGKGEGDDYLNCPFNKESYEAFVAELIAAERAPIHAFEAGGVRGEVEVDDAYKLPLEEKFLEQIKYFAGCMPIEAIAEKGARSLAFGNFKPMGLTDPRTGRRPWAALQLRPENKEKTLYSMVACQTRLKFGEQRRVFRMVPGLENAEFVRYGVIHRNTYIEAPKTLQPWLEMREVPGLFIAGQLTGVEGYVESAAMGILAGWVVARRLRGEAVTMPPRPTAYGALLAHLQDETPREFAPMNINWGILPDPEEPTRDKALKRAKKLEAAHTAFEEWYAGSSVPA
jgi:methylenetetrahydrofolate--tRNA-(uracil-5-)-methyltransferase